MSWAIKLPNEVSVVQPHIQDKILGYNRPAGVHLYRTSYLRNIIQNVDMYRDSKRPETLLLQDYQKTTGRYFVNIPILFGYHDFNQSYKDLLRKSFLHGIKHSTNSRLLIDYWFKCYLITKDYDYLVIMHGYLFGLKSNRTSTISSSDEEIENIYTNFVEREKKPLDFNNFGLHLKKCYQLPITNQMGFSSVLEFPSIKNIGILLSTIYYIKMLFKAGIFNVLRKSMTYFYKKNLL